MENIEFSQTKTGINVEGFPGAVKVIAIEGNMAKRLADLSLHNADLEFSNECLDAINIAPQQPLVIRESLWRSAIIHYFKCFGNGARFQLVAKKVYKGEPTEAMEVFDYFKGLRNKHMVHDENSYAQSIPGAILNNGSKSYSIEKIMCFTAFGSTLEQTNYSNLKLLVQKAQVWVVREFDILCGRLTAELEKQSYECLLARKEIKYRVPVVDDIGRKR
ncbi:MAG: hypothetical protein AB2745_14250 [Candidatus Thiodiazotropha endolucinida]